MDILRAETPHWANAGCSFFNGTILLGRFGELANSMNDRLAPLSFPHSRPFRSVGVGGMIVGALDLAYAILVYSPGHPILIPQTIASGILGVNAFSGGYRPPRSELFCISSSRWARQRSITWPAASSHFLSGAPFLAASLMAHWFTCSCIPLCCHSRLYRKRIWRLSIRSQSSSSTGSASACPSRFRFVIIRAEILDYPTRYCSCEPEMNGC